MPDPTGVSYLRCQRSVLESRYEKLEDFKKLVTTYDPSGKFRNDFLSGTIY